MTYSQFRESIEQAATEMGDTDVLDILGKIIFTDEIETMATNAHNIFVNPSFAESIAPKEAVAVLVHEMMHDGLLHHDAIWAIYDPDSGISRGQWHELANIAEDIVINDWLVGHGYQLPGDYCTRSKFTPPVKASSTTSAEMFSDLLEYVKQQNRLKGDIPDWLKKILQKIAQGIIDKQKVAKLPPQKQEDKPNKPTQPGPTGPIISISQDEPEGPDGPDQPGPTTPVEPEKPVQPDKPDEPGPTGPAGPIAGPDEPDEPREPEEPEKPIGPVALTEPEDEGDKDEDAEDGDAEGVDDEPLIDISKKIAARAAELHEVLTKEKTAEQVEADSYVPVKQTWIDRIFMEMGRYLNNMDRQWTYARPSRRTPQSLPGSDIVTPLRGSIQRNFSARAVFYLDVSGSMYYGGVDLPNSIRAELEKNAMKLRNTRSVVRPFASSISAVPLDVSQWIDKSAVHRALSSGTNMTAVIDDINAQTGVSEVYAIITDSDTPFNVDDIDRNKKVFVVTNNPEQVQGDTTRHNITLIPVPSFRRDIVD